MSGQIVVPTPGSVLQGPIFSDFQVDLNLISGVTNAVQAQVTTETNHGYSTGMKVRVNVPRTYGMNINEVSDIVVTGDTTFTTNINTSNVDPFVAPSLYPPVGFTPAQVIPISFTEMNVAT